MTAGIARVQFSSCEVQDLDDIARLNAAGCVAGHSLLWPSAAITATRTDSGRLRDSRVCQYSASYTGYWIAQEHPDRGRARNLGVCQQVIVPVKLLQLATILAMWKPTIVCDIVNRSPSTGIPGHASYGEIRYRGTSTWSSSCLQTLSGIYFANHDESCFSAGLLWNSYLFGLSDITTCKVYGHNNRTVPVYDTGVCAECLSAHTVIGSVVLMVWNVLHKLI